MPSIDDIATDAFAFRFVRAGGPGGQHVNKVSTAVELRVDVAKCRLSVDVQARLLALAGRRANLDGEIVIHSDESRSQLRNRELALQRFSELLTAAQTQPRKRIPTRPSKGAKARRVEQKTRRGKTKALRRRPNEE
jgi:ribosome-associated protein